MHITTLVQAVCLLSAVFLPTLLPALRWILSSTLVCHSLLFPGSCSWQVLTLTFPDLQLSVKLLRWRDVSLHFTFTFVTLLLLVTLFVFFLCLCPIFPFGLFWGVNVHGVILWDNAETFFVGSNVVREGVYAVPITNKLFIYFSAVRSVNGCALRRK